MRHLASFLAVLSLAACYSSNTNLGESDGTHATDDGGVADTTPDVPEVVDTHDVADSADTTPCVLDPAARSNGAYAVSWLEVIRPSIFGGVTPTLTARITSDDIYVVLFMGLAPGDTTFHMEVGQAQEWMYPTPHSRFCRDEICGWPPNQVTIFDATALCNDFGTTSRADLVFSLYPPSHPAAATPLRIVNASIRGQFDARRDRIVNGMLTGGILAPVAEAVYPMAGVSLRSLLDTVGVAMDYDANGDGVFDGWSVELRFEADFVVLEDG